MVQRKREIYYTTKLISSKKQKIHIFIMIYCLLHSMKDGSYSVYPAIPSMNIGQPHLVRTKDGCVLGEILALGDKKSMNLLLDAKKKCDQTSCDIAVQSTRETNNAECQTTPQVHTIFTQTEIQTKLNKSQLVCSSGEKNADDFSSDQLPADISTNNSSIEIYNDFICRGTPQTESNNSMIEECYIMKGGFVTPCDLVNDFQQENITMSTISAVHDSEATIQLIDSSPLEHMLLDCPTVYSPNVPDLLEVNNEQNVTLQQEETPFLTSFAEKSQPIVSRDFAVSHVGEAKFYWCRYCKKKVSKFARHLENVHSDLDEVAKYMSFPKKHPFRLKEISKLRAESEYDYNKTIGFQEKNVIVRRRSEQAGLYSNYLPCPQCKCLFKKQTLFRHFKTCNKNMVSKCRTVQSEAKLTKLSFEDVGIRTRHPLMTKILCSLSDDHISAEAKGDEIILYFGDFLCNTMSMKVNCVAIVRSKIRLLARILREIKKLDPAVQNMKDCFNPKNFHLIIAVARILGKFEAKHCTYTSPAVATDIGQTLKKCARVCENLSLINSDSEFRSNIITFLKLLDFNYGPMITKQASQAQKEAKFNKPEQIPTAADVHVLMNYLHKVASKSYHQLLESEDREAFDNLNRSVMLLVLIFNRRRTGETEKLLLKNYQNRRMVDKDSDLYRTLTNEEKELSSQFWRVECRGKRERLISILLTNEMVRWINKIVNLRSSMGIHDDNEFLFANETINRRYNACKALRDLSSLSGAQEPLKLRGTNLRKQFATVLQMLDLTDNETRIIADFLGHDINVHYSHYRKPTLALHTGYVSKALLAATDKNFEQYRGQTISNINIGSNMFTPSGTSDSEKNVTQECESNIQNSEMEQSTFETLAQFPISSPTRSDGTDVMTIEELPELNTVLKRKRNFELQENSDPDFQLAISDNDSECSTESSKKRWRRGPVTRKAWTTPEKTTMRNEFGKYLQTGKLPSIKKCIFVKSAHKELSGRTAEQMKSWVHAEYKRKNTCIKIVQEK